MSTSYKMMIDGYSGVLPPKDEEDKRIRDVWVENLEEEFYNMCQYVEKFNYVAMDTEFPGVVARPIGSFQSTTERHFQTLRCNVDLLKIIQIGITFADKDGNMPDGVCTWQFNFKFNLKEDMYAEDSINLLKTSGIQFESMEKRGIDVADFGELLMVSGLVLNPDVRWISFHSGYDFGYLLKLLSFKALPATDTDFFELMYTHFPKIIDVKQIMSAYDLKGGLNDIADSLKCRRIGPKHQAGSDALLTAVTFYELRDMYKIDDRIFYGKLYGLGHPTIENLPTPNVDRLKSQSLSSSSSGNEVKAISMSIPGLSSPTSTPSAATTTLSATSSNSIASNNNNNNNNNNASRGSDGGGISPTGSVAVAGVVNAGMLVNAVETGQALPAEKRKI